MEILKIQIWRNSWRKMNIQRHQVSFEWNGKQKTKTPSYRRMRVFRLLFRFCQQMRCQWFNRNRIYFKWISIISITFRRINQKNANSEVCIVAVYELKLKWKRQMYFWATPFFIALLHYHFIRIYINVYDTYSRWIRTGGLVFGSIVAYVGSICLLMSFCSPYWIESYEESFSNFKNMGLWEYCFKEFYYPYYQFPRKFNGCHNIFSNVSHWSNLLNLSNGKWHENVNNFFVLYFSGVLRHSWIFGASMVAHRSSMPNHFIHIDVLVIGHFSTWIGTMAIENCFAIRMADDESVLHSSGHIQ